MMKICFTIIILLANILFAGDRFEFCVIRHNGFYGSYSSAYENFLKYLNITTSIDPPMDVKEVSISEDLLKYPFAYISAKGKLPVFSNEELRIFSKFLSSGGLLLIDDSAGWEGNIFFESVEEFVKKIFPDEKLEKIPSDDVLFQSFYLKPKVAGRTRVSDFLWGVRKDSRWVIIYSCNDLMGVWERDETGRFLLECTPGGEAQRQEAMKLSVNIVMYALTGTYKHDIIHKEFIERKLKR